MGRMGIPNINSFLKYGAFPLPPLSHATHKSSIQFQNNSSFGVRLKGYVKVPGK